MTQNDGGRKGRNRQAGARTLDILLKEVTPAMLTEGALVLRLWATEDPEFSGLSLEALAGTIYSSMRKIRPTTSRAGQSPDADVQARKIAGRLKARIRPFL